MTDVTLTHDHPPTAQAVPGDPSRDYPLSTLCLRLDVDGIGLSWTLRGDDSDVASRLPRILDYIKRLQAKLPKPEAPPRPPVEPIPLPPVDEREDYCPIHGTGMVLQSNDRGSWYSHKTPEGWCKGRRKKAGA